MDSGLFSEVKVHGYLVRDPMVVAGGRLVRFTVLTRRTYNSADGVSKSRASFVDVEAWDEPWKSWVVKNLHKGQGVKLKGELDQDQWVNKQDVQMSQLRVNIGLEGSVELEPACDQVNHVRERERV